MSSILDVRTVPALDFISPEKFPNAPHQTAALYFDGYMGESARAAASIDTKQLERAATLLTETYVRGATVFSCGNGGSASLANHFQCDHVKGIRTKTDLSPRVMSLSSSVELLTAIANDIEFEDVFAYQLQSQARPGDVLIAISSSGRSVNIVRVVAWACEHDVRTIVLTGFDGGHARSIADVAIHVDCSNYGIVEDLHQVIIHALAQYVRQSRMTPEAISSTIF